MRSFYMWEFIDKRVREKKKNKKQEDKEEKEEVKIL